MEPKKEEQRMEKRHTFFRLRRFAFFLTAVVLVANLISFVIPSAQALVGRLYKGDKVEAVLDCQISTDTVKVGTQFMARVNKAFEKGEDIYIYEGDPVFATVESVKKPGCYGKGAELIVRFDSTLSSGGTFVPLKGRLTFKGKGKRTLACVLFFIGWAIKGRHVQTTGGESCVTEVDVGDYIDIEFKP
jgi:hypothetical protein